MMVKADGMAKADGMRRQAMQVMAMRVAVLAVVGGLQAGAQAPGEADRTARALPACARPTVDMVQRLHLSNASSPNDANEIQTALRNMLNPDAKVYFVASANDILVCTGPEQVALAQKLVRELDAPKKTYRLTFTITESEAGKRLGVQHFALTAAPGQRTSSKQGSKVPVVTGAAKSTGTSPDVSVTYLDVGINMDVTVNEVSGGLMLRSKVEQSAVAEERSVLGAQDPVIRQMVMEGIAFVPLGKTLMLGSLDVTGSPRHVDVEVEAELVK